MNKHIFVTPMTFINSIIVINPIVFFFCFQELQVNYTLRHLFVFFTLIEEVLFRIETTKILSFIFIRSYHSKIRTLTTLFIFKESYN
jgi:hypothetical protein